ncbi:c-type cytochrome [Arcobacter arenosus]|jgi:cytochrome c553|uniref:c-type cytochrome n=1 Tax=Arcobacter arenosus TaxID=2576037 RepID=UPI003BAB710C
MKTTRILTGVALLGLTSLFANDGAGLYQSCAACHGINAEKAALGKSQIIKGWDAAKIETALKGYKDGSYGGAMKGVMKGQVARLSDADIKALAEYISKM